MDQLVSINPKEIVKKEIEQAEAEFLKHEQVDCPVIHRFGPGVYIREVMIPGGSLAIGHHQNFEHMNVFLKGRVTMLNDDGSTTELRAPMIFTGKPGRKIGFIHEDMVWLNIYATEEKDVEKLESHFLTKSAAWLTHAQSEGVKLLSNSADIEDYKQVLSDFGITEEEARSVSENLSDMTELPFGEYKFKVAKSSIDGNGLFATADISPNEEIAPARIKSKRTIAGRFTNHAKDPNAQMVSAINGDICLFAIKPIKGCRGGQDGEEITVNYRDALKLNLKLGMGV